MLALSIFIKTLNLWIGKASPCCQTNQLNQAYFLAEKKVWLHVPCDNGLLNYNPKTDK